MALSLIKWLQISPSQSCVYWQAPIECARLTHFKSFRLPECQNRTTIAKMHQFKDIHYNLFYLETRRPTNLLGQRISTAVWDSSDCCHVVALTISKLLRSEVHLFFFNSLCITSKLLSEMYDYKPIGLGLKFLNYEYIFYQKREDISGMWEYFRHSVKVKPCACVRKREKQGSKSALLSVPLKTKLQLMKVRCLFFCLTQIDDGWIDRFSSLD